MPEHPLSHWQRLARELKAWHLVLAAVVFFISTGAGLGATLIAFGEVRVETKAKAAVTPLEARVQVIELAVSKAVSREELREELRDKNEREREWREDISRELKEIRLEIQRWHSAATSGSN